MVEYGDFYPRVIVVTPYFVYYASMTAHKRCRELYADPALAVAQGVSWPDQSS